MNMCYIFCTSLNDPVHYITWVSVQVNFSFQLYQLCGSTVMKIIVYLYEPETDLTLYRDFVVMILAYHQMSLQYSWIM